MSSRNKKASRRSRRRPAQGLATTKKKSRRRGRARRNGLQESEVAVGAGYDLKMSNPGFTMRAGTGDNVLIKGRIAVAIWNLHAILNVPQTGFYLPMNTTYDGNNGNALHLNPITMFPPTSREYSMAFGFAEFRFKKCILEVQSTTATSIQASGCIAYTADGAVDGVSMNTQAEIFAFPNSVAMPAWGSRSMDISRYLTRDAWYYIDLGSSLGSSSDSDLRQAFQGVFGGLTIGFTGLASGTTDYAAAVVYLSYELELRGPRVTGDLVLQQSRLSALRGLRLKREKETLKLKNLRLLREAKIADLDRMEDDSDGDTEYPLPVSRPESKVELSSPLPKGGPPRVGSLVVASSKATKAEK